jgi:hypothetical protein
MPPQPKIEGEMWQSIIMGFVVFQKLTIFFHRKKEEKCDQNFFSALFLGGGGGVGYLTHFAYQEKNG